MNDSFDEHINYSGLEILVMRVIQVAQLLLDFGYLVRAAVTVGKVWHVETNIVARLRGLWSGTGRKDASGDLISVGRAALEIERGIGRQ